MYKSVERLNVFLRSGQEEAFVGVLALDKGRILFQYAPGFLSKRIEISPIRLSLSGYVQSGPPDLFFGLPGVFYDSLPDGWGLLLMDRYFSKAGISGYSIGALDRLAFIGDRGMGALVYRPGHKIESPGRKEIDIAALAKEAIHIFEGEPGEVLPQLLYLGGSPGGARPKVLIAYNELENRMISGVDDIPSGYRQFLVKFPAKTDPPYPGETEYAYSLMAREAGLKTPESRLFPGMGDQKSFGIERFDRNGNDRFHIHTLGGLVYSDHRVPSCTYETALKATQALTRNREDIVALFRQMVFNIATHNRDDHVRNFSFVLDPIGTWRLAPAYDLTYSSGPGGEHSMTLAGEGRNPAIDHILSVGEEFGFRNEEVLQIIDRVDDAVGKWNTFSNKAGVPKSVADRIRGDFVRLKPPAKRASNSKSKVNR